MNWTLFVVVAVLVVTTFGVGVTLWLLVRFHELDALVQKLSVIVNRIDEEMPEVIKDRVIAELPDVLMKRFDQDLPS